VRGIAHETNVASVAANGVTPGAARAFTARLYERGLVPKGLHHGAGALSCVISTADLHHEDTLAADAAELLGEGALSMAYGAVSLVGEGITRTGEVQAVVDRTVGELDAEVAGISTSSFRITVLVPVATVAPLVRALHTALGLDGPSLDAVIA
jgi:aspartokinase